MKPHIIDDNGMRFTQQDSFPTLPPAGNVRLFAQHNRLYGMNSSGKASSLDINNFNIFPYASGDVTTTGVTQIDIPITDSSALDLKIIHIFFRPIDTSNRFLRGTVDNDVTASYTGNRVRKFVNSQTNAGNYFNFDFVTPQSDVVSEQYTDLWASIYVWNARDASSTTTFVTRHMYYADFYNGWYNYNIQSSASNLNLFEDANREFGIGTRWTAYAVGEE